MATHRVVIPTKPDDICNVMHGIIFKNPQNEQDDIATLPVMLFGEVIEKCHKIEELESKLQEVDEEKRKSYRERRAQKKHLRSTLKDILDGTKIPRSFEKLETFAESTLQDYDDKDADEYQKLRDAYEKYSNILSKTKKSKEEYRETRKKLSKACRKEAKTLLRRVRDALKVNFYHLGKDEYLSQIKAHGFEVKKK
jgi:DNA repair ATPase RecN